MALKSDPPKTPATPAMCNAAKEKTSSAQNGQEIKQTRK
jgi:hypothetical protein